MLYHVQGTSNITIPGFVNMMRNNCVCLPTAGNAIVLQHILRTWEDYFRGSLHSRSRSPCATKRFVILEGTRRRDRARGEEMDGAKDQPSLFLSAAK